MKKLADNAFVFLAALILIYAVGRAFILPSLGLSGGVAPKPAMFAQGVALTDAIAQAKQEDKLVFAFATADWCGPCQAYKRGALADERVEAWVRENAIAVYIDADAQREESAAVGASTLPTTVLITGEGEIVGRIAGAHSVRSVLGWLGEAEAVMSALGAAVETD